MSFSGISNLFSLSSINVKFWEVPVSDLVRCSGTEYDDIVVIVGKWLLFLEVLLSFFWIIIKTQFLIIVVSNPSIRFDFWLYFFDKLFSLLYSNILFLFVWQWFFLSDLLFCKAFRFLLLWTNFVCWRLVANVFLLLIYAFNHRRFNLWLLFFYNLLDILNL